MFSICFESMNGGNRSVWASQRNVGFIDKSLLGSFMEKGFKQRTRVSHNASNFLCEMLGNYTYERQFQLKVELHRHYKSFVIMVVIIDFGLLHDVKHYINSLLSHFHANTTNLLNVTCTLVATCMILGR